ncbi:MAG: hypothetical protein DCF22_14445 [Leptolyngbya sp.]|nr:MAG: hypothetical protein DCF22_14445 [Leptolyngbya sp.]
MTEEDKSLDLAGIGKLAKAIPDSAWLKLVDTACDTFSKVIAPITSTTMGLGKLIEAKFDGMVDAQKILASDAVQRANQKIEKSNRKPKGKIKSTVIISAIEKASIETDDSIRDLWANLIANEILDGDVHPEFPRLVERISSNDAIVLLKIAERSQKEKIKLAVKAITVSLNIFGITLSALLEDESDFNREHLRNLYLIQKSEGTWKLTLFGEEFLKSVSDPSFES